MSDTLVRTTAATLNYGHLEAITKAGKRDSMERGTLVIKIMTISILKVTLFSPSKHTHTQLAHGVITHS